MDCYLVVVREDEQADRKEVPLDTSVVKNAFENCYPFTDGMAWIVAPKEPMTCGDIVDKLDLADRDSSLACIVVKMESFNGWAEKSLWEKIGMWSDT